MSRFSRESLLELLPHRPPVLALESVDWPGGDGLRAHLQVRRDSPFFHPGRGIPFWICLEFLGQGVAALESLRARREGRPPPLGYLLGSRSLTAAQEYFREGARLELEISERMQASSEIALFDGRVSDGSQSLECSFSVYRLTAPPGDG